MFAELKERIDLVCKNYGYFDARSAFGVCGKCGPAPGVSAGVFVLGFAQLTAHHREAYFGSSHIFPHPAEVFDCAHPQ